MAGSPPPLPPAISALGLDAGAFAATRAVIASGMADARAAFELTLAAPSEDWGFLVLAGVEPLVDALERLKPRSDELQWLESKGVLDATSRKRLAEWRFMCDVDAVPEGSAVFAHEAVLTVEGPLWQAMLVGGLARSSIADATWIATRFARVTLASGGAELVERGASTAHRLGGIPVLARAACVGGASATTSALAARRYGLPLAVSHPIELDAVLAGDPRSLRAWIAAAGERVVVSIPSARARPWLTRLVAALRDLGDSVPQRVVVELPDGDRAGLARQVSLAFVAAGLAVPVVHATGEIDERLALELRAYGDEVHGFVMPAVADPATSRLARYEMVALESSGAWAPVLRGGRDAATTNDPGRKLLVRYVDASGRPVADVAHSTNERLAKPTGGRYVDRATQLLGKLDATSSTPLRVPVMRAGKRASKPEPVPALRERANEAMRTLDEGYLRVASPARYPVGVSPQLATLKSEMLAKAAEPA